MLSRDEIYEKVSAYLVEMFEVPPEKIAPEARLFADLDLDSIDAIDLIVQLQNLTGRKIKAEEFKTVRTIQDVVDRVHGLLAP